MVRGGVSSRYLDRAVDKQGRAVYLMLSSNRDVNAAPSLIFRAIDNNGLAGKINTFKNGASTAGLNLYIHIESTNIEMRRYKYLNTTWKVTI